MCCGQSLTKPSRLSLSYSDDLLDISRVVTTTGGGGTLANVAPPDQNHPGVIQMSVTAAVTPDRAVLTLNSGWQGEVLVTGNVIAMMEWIVAIPTLSDGVNRQSVRLGLGSTFLSAADQQDGFYFEYDLALNGDANWRGVSAKGNARTRANLNVAPVAGVYTRLKVIANAVSATYYVNDTPAATITTNIPTSPVLPFAENIKTLGAGGLTAIVDRWQLDVIGIIR